MTSDSVQSPASLGQRFLPIEIKHGAHFTELAVGIVDEGPQTTTKFGGQVPHPTGIDEAHFEQVAQMRPILVSERGQLDRDEIAKRDDVEPGPCIQTGQSQVRSRFVIPHEFIRENQVDRVPRGSLRRIQKDAHPRNMPIVEARALQGDANVGQIGSSD